MLLGEADFSTAGHDGMLLGFNFIGLLLPFAVMHGASWVRLAVSMLMLLLGNPLAPHSLLAGAHPEQNSFH